MYSGIIALEKVNSECRHSSLYFRDDNSVTIRRMFVCSDTENLFRLASRCLASFAVSFGATGSSLGIISPDIFYLDDVVQLSSEEVL